MIKIDQTYTIEMTDYPWSDAYARINSTMMATLLKEDQAKQFLSGQEIKITDVDPDQVQFHKGDRGIQSKWIRGKMVSGQMKGSGVAIMGHWLKVTNPQCSCDTSTLMLQGCQCGGI